MLQSARSRYLLAAALWAASVAWVAFGPAIADIRALLLAASVTATVCGAIVERDDRVQQTIRLSWWACEGVRGAGQPPIPCQREVAATTGANAT